MFKAPLVKISEKFNIPYRTLQNFKNKEDYRKEVVDIMSDLIILEEVVKEDLEKFTDAEITYIKDAIDNYLTDVLINNKDINVSILSLIKDNNKLKDLVEEAILEDYLDPKPVLYKIDKYLDKLDRYFLVRERFKDVENHLKNVKFNEE